MNNDFPLELAIASLVLLQIIEGRQDS